MDQNHSDLAKFKHSHDKDFLSLTVRLKGFWDHAVEDIRSRFDSEGELENVHIRSSG